MTGLYTDSERRSYQSILIFSPVTISIRYTGEDGVQKDVHWLADQVQRMDQILSGISLSYINSTGLEEKLQVRDEETISAILKIYRHKKFTGGKAHKRRYVLPLALLGTLIGVFLFFYLLIIPMIGERMAGRVSKDWEMGLGNEMYDVMMQQYKIDPQLTSKLNRFYLASGFDVPYDIQITVIREPELNAFALPGGNIVVHDGILKEMNSSDELAALLSHEVSHVSERHSLRNLFRTYSRKMFLALVIGNHTGMASVLVDQADALKGLEYSRALETEADERGLELMSRNNINMQGMVSLMKILQSATKGSEPSPFLSTHPVFKERITLINQKIAALPKNVQENEELEELFQSIKQP
ncbi:MAG: M48 family metallopeptidase [Flavitalea sp.]